MTKTELAKLLGVSRAIVHRLEKRGMPVDNLQAAISWRSKNLDITQTKQGRIDGNTGGRKSNPHKAKEGQQNSMTNQLSLNSQDAEEVYRNARALKEKFLALQADVDYRQAIGDLVEKTVVEKIIFERARQFRDGVTASSKRLAPLLVGKESLKEIEIEIDKELRYMLDQFSKLPVIE